MAYTEDRSEQGDQTVPAHTDAVGASDDMSDPRGKSTKSPAFQFYPKDFLSSSKVGLMSMTERGVYITLLSLCWLDNGLSADLRALAKLVGMKHAQFERLWTNGALSQCFYEKGGKFHNERLDRERLAQAEFRRKQKERAESRWHPKLIGNATALPITGNADAGNALQSSSAICNLQSAERATRPAPLIAKRRLHATFEGARGLYVPTDLHRHFIDLRHHDGATAELLTFYEAVSEAYAVGPRKGENPDPDMYKFWRARFVEKWPATATPKADNRLPTWAQNAIAKRDAKHDA